MEYDKRGLIIDTAELESYAENLARGIRIAEKEKAPAREPVAPKPEPASPEKRPPERREPAETPAPPRELLPVPYREELLRELRRELSLLPFTQLQIADLLGAEGFLVLSCKSRAQADFLSDRTVLQKIREKAARFAGGEVAVSVRVEGEEEKKTDPLNDLLRFGSENPDIADVQ